MAEYAFVVSVGVESFDWGTQGDEWVHRVSECMAETDSFFSVQLANNPGGGRGGTCFGDSGGPTLLGDTDVIVGVTSWGFSPTCGGVGFAYRTDQQAVIDWILEHAGSEADEITIVTI